MASAFPGSRRGHGRPSNKQRDKTTRTSALTEITPYKWLELGSAERPTRSNRAGAQSDAEAERGPHPVSAPYGPARGPARASGRALLCQEVCGRLVHAEGRIHRG